MPVDTTRPRFYGGSACLDFANTIEPRGAPAERDHLGAYPDLVTWARSAGLLDRGPAADLRRLADRYPAGAAEALAAAVTLREALYRIFSAVARRDEPDALSAVARRGEPDALSAVARRDEPDAFSAIARRDEPDPGDLAVLAQTYLDGRRHADLRRGGDCFQWVYRTESHLWRPLWPVATSAVDLLTSPRLGRVKVCPAVCGWLFLDTTKNGQRRWCSMQECGVEAKVRRQAERRRTAAS
jgi:predicted RNA-binding Zn ribbon-like protein